MSRADHVALSPRNLEQLRKNGQSILNQTFTQQMGDRRNSMGPRVTSDELDLDIELDSNPKMHLVPCRWAPGGWKYVEQDPKEKGFFNSPNRVNAHGVQANRGRFSKSVNRTFGHGKGSTMSSNFETTYGRCFYEMK